MVLNMCKLNYSFSCVDVWMPKLCSTSSICILNVYVCIPIYACMGVCVRVNKQSEGEKEKQIERYKCVETILYYFFPDTKERDMNIWRLFCF